MPNPDEITLGTLAADVPSAFATGPFGSAVSARYFTASGVPMLRGSNLSDDVGVQLDDSDVVFVSEHLAREFARSIARVGDLVFTCWGTVGQIGLIRSESRFSEYLVSNKQMKMTPNPTTVSPLFLYYYLSQPAMLELVRGQAIGSSVPGFNLGQLKALPVRLPSLREQIAVAEVLGALDDKIAANSRVMGIADEWVRARFNQSEGAPVSIGALAVNVREQVDPSSIDQQTPYVGLEHVPRRRMWLSKADTAAKITSTKTAFKFEDVLFGKLRPYFHKVVAAPFDGICSTDILVLRAKDARLAGLLLAAAASDQAISATSAASEGTRMPRTKWADLAGVEVPWPGDAAALAFSAEVAAIAQQTGALIVESGALARTRDELLPLLMSGRLRVNGGAEQVAEGVA